MSSNRWVDDNDSTQRAWSNVDPDQTAVAQPIPEYNYPSEPAPQQQPSSNSTNPLLVAAIAVVATLLVVALGFFLFTTFGDTASQSSADGADSETAATQDQSGDSESSTKSTATGDYGDGLEVFKTCDAQGASWVGTGTSTTSCPFATNVGIALAEVKPGQGEKTGTVYSPTTGKNYRMTCNINHDRNDQEYWRCTGGVNAVVFVYP